MVDTIWLRCSRLLAYNLRGWKRTFTDPEVEGGGYRYERFASPDGNIRLCLRFTDPDRREIYKVEFELPTAVYPHNGFQLQSQEEIDQALAWLEAFLNVISRRLLPADTEYFSRIDMVAHMPNEVAREFCRIYRHMRVPGSNAEPKYHGINGLSWFGAEQEVSFYNKISQLRKKLKKARKRQSGGIQGNHDAQFVFLLPELWRFEYRLFGQKLAKIVGQGSKVTRIDYRFLRSVFWNYLDSFQLSIVTVPGNKIEDFLAGERVLRPDDDVVARYTAQRNLCKRRASNLRREVGKRVVNVRAFRWRDHQSASDALRETQHESLREVTLKEIPTRPRRV